jgi:hypothetical protein
LSWSTVLTEVLKLLNTLFSTPEKQIKKVNNIYDEMHRILSDTPVERLLILKAHNGGGVIKPSGNLYVSVLYEDYDQPFKSVKANYQALPVDKDYARMLLDVLNQKKVFINTETAPSTSILKSLYELEGVKSSAIYCLGQDKKAVYFCTFSASKPLEDWLDSSTTANLEIASNKFSQNLK